MEIFLHHEDLKTSMLIQSSRIDWDILLRSRTGPNSLGADADAGDCDCDWPGRQSAVGATKRQKKALWCASSDSRDVDVYVRPDDASTQVPLK